MAGFHPRLSHKPIGIHIDVTEDAAAAGSATTPWPLTAASSWGANGSARSSLPGQAYTGGALDSPASTSGASPHAAASAAAKLKALQRTPYPMVLARLKVLLERLRVLLEAEAEAEEEACSTSLYSGSPPSTSFYSGSPPSTQPSCAYTTGGSSCWAPETPSPTRWTAGGASARRSSAGGMRPPGSPAGHRKQMLDPSSAATDMPTSKYSLQDVLQELSIMFSFTSDFLRGLPGHTRRTLCRVVRMEAYKKDQVIYDIGDAADRFYVILLGQVEVYTHPPGRARQKTTVSLLRRGQVFGDQALLNNERRSTAVAPTTNTTLLVVNKEDFLAVLGGYFQAVQATMQSFLLHQVAPFQGISSKELARLCSHMLVSTFKAGKTWQLAAEEQVYFVKEGTCALELVTTSALARGALRGTSRPGTASGRLSSTARRSRSSSSGTGGPGASSGGSSSKDASGRPSTSGGSAGAADGGNKEGDVDAVPWMWLATEGPLAGLKVQEGRVVGTLGEEEGVVHHHDATGPRQVIAELSSGAVFGGGAAIIGTGPVQSGLRVVVTSPSAEVYHMHVDAFLNYGDTSLVSGVRDDIAFKLTYYLGRVAQLAPGQVIGHPQAAIAHCSSRIPSEAEQLLSSYLPGARYTTEVAPGAAAAAGAPGGFGDASADGAPSSHMHTRTKRSSTVGLMTGSAAAAGGSGGADAAASRTQDVAGVTAGGTGLIGATVSSSVGQATGAASAAKKVNRTAKAKFVRVPGSGQFSPPVAAAIAHLNTLHLPGILPLNGQQQQQQQQHHSGSSSSNQCLLQTSGAPTTSSHPRSSVSGCPDQQQPTGGRCSVVGVSDTAAATAGPSNSAGQAGGTSSSSSSAAGRRRPQTAGGPAAQQYWSSTCSIGSGVSTALTPLLGSMYPEGLEPLVSVLEHVAFTQKGSRMAEELARPMTAPGPSATAAAGMGRSGGHATTGLGSSLRVPSGGLGSSMRGPGTLQHSLSTRRPNSAGAGPQATIKQPVRPADQPGALLAASVLWQRTSEACMRPSIRQCLTFEEIGHAGP